VKLRKIFKSKLLRWLIGNIIIGYLVLLKHTCKIVVVGTDEYFCGSKQHIPKIFLAWHGRVAGLLVKGSKSDGLQVVASAHGDGDFISIVLKHFDYQVIRGSSRKQRLGAMKEIMEIDKENLRLFITPDGPKGPAFKVKGSVLSIAQKYDVPIISLTSSVTKAITLNTWDHFVLPIPFLSTIYVSASEPKRYSEFNDLDDVTVFMNAHMKSIDEIANV